MEPTIVDATKHEANDESFVVTTHTTQANYFTVSNVVTGHSLDNLKPNTPKSLAGTFVPTSTLQLTWAPNTEPDLLEYAIYRGMDPSFVPSDVNLLGSTRDVQWTDDAFTVAYSYKVSAIDSSGNESDFADLSPQQVLDAPDAGTPAVSFLGAVAPNPLVSTADIRFGLSRAAPVRIAVFDLAGRLTRVLVDATRAAGTYRLQWDGRDDQGRRAHDGIYFIRLLTPGLAEARKLILSH